MVPADGVGAWEGEWVGAVAVSEIDEVGVRESRKGVAVSGCVELTDCD